VKGRHGKTLDAIFSEPTLANIPWREIESLFAALGGEISEGKGSRVRVALNNAKAVFHRPHKRKEASKSQVESVRTFLERAGVTP
jgi:hypothetical protein